MNDYEKGRAAERAALTEKVEGIKKDDRREIPSDYDPGLTSALKDLRTDSEMIGYNQALDDLLTYLREPDASQGDKRMGANNK